jgi:hypothetical protein
MYIPGKAPGVRVLCVSTGRSDTCSLMTVLTTPCRCWCTAPVYAAHGGPHAALHLAPAAAHVLQCTKAVHTGQYRTVRGSNSGVAPPALLQHWAS